MRKLICLLLALMLLPCAAFAEAVPETVAYTHPDLGYSMDLPSDWILIDSETIDAVLDAVASGEAEFTLDSETLSQYAEQIDTTNMMMALSADAQTNVNVVAQELGATFSADIVAEQLCPSLVAQYQALFTDCVFEDDGSVVTAGETEFARISVTYTLNGVFLRLHQYVLIENDVMYCITFTNAASEAAMTLEEMAALALPILETFTAPAA